MTDTSARFALPLIEPGQAQKELYHNEALTLLDIGLHASVAAVGTLTPPATPTPGQCWAVGSAPTGAWIGQGGKLAAWTAGGWRFVAPVPGMLVWSVADGVQARWDDAAWSIGMVVASGLKIGGNNVVGAQRPAIADPAAGSTSDVQARAAIAAILAALRAHGLIAT